MKRTLSSCLFVAALACGGAAHASDPIGVYSIVGKVVLEPSAAAPERIRICGAFAKAIPMSGGKYSSPESGYYYYKCDPAQLALCRAAFADIAKAAGGGSCIGFGERYGQNGTLRSTLPIGDADLFPQGIGVVKMPSGDLESMAACQQLQGRPTMHDACKDPEPADMASPQNPPPNPPKASGGCSAMGVGSGAAGAPSAGFAVLAIGGLLAGLRGRRRRA